jgi:hypothetical protein
MLFRATAIRPAPDLPMPTIEEYLALAEAMHDESDFCNANYQLSFADCEVREADIQDAVTVLVALRKEGWRLVRDVNATAEMGL